jgi:hypothetical protein
VRACSGTSWPHRPPHTSPHQRVSVTYPTHSVSSFTLRPVCAACVITRVMRRTPWAPARPPGPFRGGPSASATSPPSHISPPTLVSASSSSSSASQSTPQRSAGWNGSNGSSSSSASSSSSCSSAMPLTLGLAAAADNVRYLSPPNHASGDYKPGRIKPLSATRSNPKRHTAPVGIGGRCLAG